MHHPLNSNNNPTRNPETTEVTKIAEKEFKESYAISRKKLQNDDIHSQELEKFGTQWFKERSRQAKMSFNIAVGLAGTTATLSIILAVSLAAGKVSIAAIAELGSISGAVSAYCFKLSQNANKLLDAAAKELLDNK